MKQILLNLIPIIWIFNVFCSTYILFKEEKSSGWRLFAIITILLGFIWGIIETIGKFHQI